MAYCTAADVQAYSGVAAGTDDALLAVLIASAQAWIDNHTGRTFEASADTARTLGMDRVDGRRLWLDRDLCQITSVMNNYDNGSSGVEVTAAQYTLKPKNDTPYYAIDLLGSVALSWEYTSDPENAVRITGRWAYSVTAPAVIKQACIRLTTYMYRQKDASTFDTTAIPDAGVIMTPQGMPKDVAIMLDPYRRIVLA